MKLQTKTCFQGNLRKNLIIFFICFVCRRIMPPCRRGRGGSVIMYRELSRPNRPDCIPDERAGGDFHLCTNLPAPPHHYTSLSLHLSFTPFYRTPPLQHLFTPSLSLSLSLSLFLSHSFLSFAVCWLWISLSSSCTGIHKDDKIIVVNPYGLVNV